MQPTAILILDALGIRGIWRRKDPIVVLDNWRRLRTLVEEMERDLKEKYGSESTWSTLVISDTIIITGSGDDRLDVIETAAVIAARIVARGILEGFRYRGAISFGDAEIKNGLLVGPAVDEAAEDYEATEWIGVHLTPKAYSQVQESLKHGEDRWCNYLESALASDFAFLLGPRQYEPFDWWTKWDVPFKRGSRDETLCVGWPIDFEWLIDESASQSERGCRFDQFTKKQLAHLLADMNEDKSLHAKFTNTMAFYEAYAAHHSCPLREARKQAPD